MPKVLIADDERLSNIALRLFLTDRGHDVRTAESAEEAISVGLAYRPDVLVTDFLLGDDLKGTDVARSLQSNDPGLKVVLLTGLPEDRVRGDLDGVREAKVCPKPFDLDALLALIAELTIPPPGQLAGA
jgi:DNA-binding response OmpR family regulator